MGDYRVIVVGAGMSGVCAAIQLRKAGIAPIRVFEKASSVGGTWRDNTYPGVACDVPSHLYSFSFDLNPSWSKMYSPGGEIWDYLQRCAEKHGILSDIQFETRVEQASFEDGRWTVRTAAGEVHTADMLIAALGGLHVPNIPDFDGLEDFEGPVFHTASWRHDVDLAGRRVALIGTGASAVQCAPEIAKVVERLSVFQRSPSWVLPKRDPDYREDEKERFRRSPLSARLHRFKIWKDWESFGVDVVRDTERNRTMKKIGEKTIRKTVRDPELAEKLVPDYPYGCKRPTLSNDYYPMFNLEHVELVTSPIVSIDKRGILTEDGARHEVDVIVMATGFKPFDITNEMKVRGLDGVELRDVWKERVTSYRTVMVPGFPNFLIMLGPNSGGLTSALQMIEVQARFAVRFIQRLRRWRARYMHPRADATAAWNEELQRDLGGTLTNVGCRSWWTDRNGYNHTMWPHSSVRYRLLLRSPRRRDFEVVG